MIIKRRQSSCQIIQNCKTCCSYDFMSHQTYDLGVKFEWSRDGITISKVNQSYLQNRSPVKKTERKQWLQKKSVQQRAKWLRQNKTIRGKNRANSHLLKCNVWKREQTRTSWTGLRLTGWPEGSFPTSAVSSPWRKPQSPSS